MSYLTQNTIATNSAMHGRLAQCAASEGIENPDNWVVQHNRTLSAAPGWDAAWEYALNVHHSDPAYDPGLDEAVITDGMILAEVQHVRTPPVVQPVE